MVRLVFLLSTLACRMATVVDACEADPSWCTPCEDDGECVLSGNPCLESVYCAQETVPLSVIEIGCSDALEYQWPAASTCTCQANTCASIE